MDIYPTIVDDFIHIRKNFDSGAVELSAISMLGQKISVQINADTSADLSDLPPGIYQLILKKDKQVYQTKFIKK